MTLLFGASDFARAATAPALVAAQNFAVLGASTVTNTGGSAITGDLGLSPGSAITGFPPGFVSGTVHATDGAAAAAQVDVTAAYNNLAGQACTTNYAAPQDLVGLTLPPGVYCFASSAGLTGALTLDAVGDSNAVFVFKIASTLTTGPGATVTVINSGQNGNVFWQVGSSATLGTGTAFKGNILALNSISLTTNASLIGRALARNGAVTLDTNAVTLPSATPAAAAAAATAAAAAAAAFAAASIPTLSEWGVILLASLVAMFGLRQVRRRREG